MISSISNSLSYALNVLLLLLFLHISKFNLISYIQFFQNPTDNSMPNPEKEDYVA